MSVRNSVFNSIRCKNQGKGRGPACAPPRKVIDYQATPTPTPSPTPTPRQPLQSPRWEHDGPPPAYEDIPPPDYTEHAPNSEAEALQQRQALEQSHNRALDWRNEAINSSWQEWLHRNSGIPPETTDYSRYTRALSDRGLDLNELAPRPEEDQYPQYYRDQQTERERRAQEYRENGGPPPSYDSIPPPAYDGEEPLPLYQGPNSTTGRENMNNNGHRRPMSDQSLPSNEDELEGEDKTPYRSVSTRAPISDPRGINPALEDDGSGIDPGALPGPDNTLRNTGLQLGSLKNYYDAQAPIPPDGPAPSPIRANVKQMIQARKSGLNPGNQAAIDRIKASMGDDAPSMPPPSPPAAPQMPGQVAPSEPDSNPPPPDAEEADSPPGPQDTQTSPGASPDSPPSDPGMGGLPPYLPNYSNYYLAGVQGAFGGMKATGQNDLSNAINQQNGKMQSQMQAQQLQRAKVMQAIANQKAAQTFTSGQNDLNRQNRLDAVVLRGKIPAKPKDPQTQKNWQNNYDFKKSKYIQGRFDSLNTGLSEELARGNTPFAIAARNTQAINNVRQLIAGKANPDDLNPQEVFETAKSLDRVLSQGNPTDASTGHLTPNNAGTWIAEALQHVTNSTKAAGAGEYIKNISKTLDREYNQANSTLTSARNKRLSTVQDLKKLDPVQWREIMTRHNINEDGSSISHSSGSSDFPKTVKKGKETATVSNQQELDEATSEGFE